ncbi:MAG: NAD(P)-binding protein [Evtepia sp.]
MQKLSRLRITERGEAQQTVGHLYANLERRISAAPAGNCPVELTRAFLQLCLAQSCGKCVPCRVGLDRLAALINQVLDGEGSMEDLEVIHKTALSIAASADCAIGLEAAKLVLEGFAAFRDDYLSHVEKGRCTENFNSVPCVSSCPAHVDIPGYISLIGDKRYADAVRLIRKDNPFPSTCALICEHPCEAHCRRSIVDDAINIRGLKRYAVDMAGAVPPPQCATATGKTVAVIGGGPSGLTAAYFLSLMGHKVTVFEKRERLGGMLRYGIPSYRLPDDYLDADIDAILATGVEVKLNFDVGETTTLEDLREQFDSVYLSIGAHSVKKLGIPGEKKRGVLSAVELLGSLGDDHKPDFTGRNVVVVGGGNVAMDATRTAMRLGAASVRCVYRRRVTDMTALPDEISGAMAEGCEIITLKAPVRVEWDDQDNVTGLVVQRQVVGAMVDGRPKPYKADVPEELIPCDMIVVAIGQAIDSLHFAAEGVVTRRDTIVTQGDAALSGKDGVFSGGDCVSGPATVIRAVEYGKIAAANIDEYLGCHTDISVLVDVPAASFRFKPACGRANMTEREASARKDDFELMECGVTDQEAQQECARCLRCDHYGYAGFKGGRITKW